MSTFNTLLKKASGFLKIGVSDVVPKDCLPGEAIFCKNNVCVHPPTTVRTDLTHYPGYLTIKEKIDEVLGSTLVLMWIPNATLKKNPRTLENRTPESSPCRSSYSSKQPSPTLSRSSFYFSSTCHSPYASSDKSLDEIAQLHLASSSSDKRSINSVLSEGGGSQESFGSPDNSSCVRDQTDITTSIDYQSLTTEAIDLSMSSIDSSKVHCDVIDSSQKASSDSCQTQTDSGIGPEDVIAALEKMICGLNDMDASETDITKPCNLSSICEPNGPTVQYSDGGHCCQDTSQECPNEQNTNNPILTEKCIGMKHDLKLCLSENLNESEDHSQKCHPDICITPHSPAHSRSSSATPTTSNRDPESCPSTPAESPSNSPQHMALSEYLYVEGTPESLAQLHNLSFPEGTVKTSDKFSKTGNVCGIFSVDLSLMRSLRLFFSNKECTSGQLVISSRESQYKILHFHHGGLDKLAKVFEDYNFLSKSKSKGSENSTYQHFSICRPEVTKAECHPEEGIYSPVTEIQWRQFMNEDGIIEDDIQLRKEIFFGGLDPKLRKEAWPFLLHYYELSSTYDRREQMRNDKYIEYQGIRRKREHMTEEELYVFWRNIQCTVEKDVVRTDRSNPFFSGDDNPNIEIMKNILLNYGFYNPKIGYTQGMSDLLAPVLAAVQNEADAFWCFVGLMQKTIFVTCPKDFDMDVNLVEKYTCKYLVIVYPADVVRVNLATKRNIY